MRRDHEAAGFLDYQNHPAPGAPQPVDLQGEIEALMREGIDLVTELSKPMEPERVGADNWKVSVGDAPDEWREKADAFFQGGLGLLKRRQPALLKDFEQGFNGHFRAQEEASGGQLDHANDKRSDPEKLLDFANATRGTPKETVEASLDGLTEARCRLGG